MLALLGIAALLGAWASAAPQYPNGVRNGANGGFRSGGFSGGPQTPFKFPLRSGFPNVQNPSAALTGIERQAHGTLPNGPLPKTIQDNTTTNVQLIAFNEIFEVAYFTALLQNITSGAPGYQVQGAAHQIVVNALTAVQGQEQLHYLGANAILKSAGREPIQPCEYIFPVNNFDEAIQLAYTFTDLVVGTLLDAQQTFAKDGDTELVPLIGSVVGQEGEQNGFYRNIERKIPSELPFLTMSAGPFAFSAINQMFVVPGSCPNAKEIKLPIFPPLKVETNMGKNLAPRDQQIEFSCPKTGNSNPQDLHITYINQQNVPVVEKIQNVRTQGNKVYFSAPFPYEKNIMNGLTIAAVTKSAGPFKNADEVAAATLYGPGLIEIL